MERKLTKTFISANLLTLEVNHNGYKGGDAGHGGFVKLKFRNSGSTAMEVNVKSGREDITFTQTGKGGWNPKCEVDFKFPEEVILNFMGDCERDTLIEALKFAIEELEQNEYVKESYEKDLGDY